jgi:hypothetical protein
MLQQSGENAPSIKGLIISGFAKSSDFAIFSSGGRLFHFKGSICVKKRGVCPHFCPKLPLSVKAQKQIKCSKCRILLRNPIIDVTERNDVLAWHH